jgi:hypothetical protein
LPLLPEEIVQLSIDLPHVEKLGLDLRLENEIVSHHGSIIDFDQEMLISFKAI